MCCTHVLTEKCMSAMSVPCVFVILDCNSLHRPRTFCCMAQAILSDRPPDSSALDHHENLRGRLSAGALDTEQLSYALNSEYRAISDIAERDHHFQHGAEAHRYPRRGANSGC